MTVMTAHEWNKGSFPINVTGTRRVRTFVRILSSYVTALLPTRSAFALPKTLLGIGSDAAVVH